MTLPTAPVFILLTIWTSIFSSAAQASVLARRNPDPPRPPPPPPPILEAMNIHHLNRSLEDKYFHEPGRDDILGHYDTRYFKGVVSDQERSETLSHMMRAYLDYFRDNKLETWIAHGTLLGWWWNSKVSVSDNMLPDIQLLPPKSGLLTKVLDLSMGLGHRYPGNGQHSCPDGGSVQPKYH
jgi:hypothetical protein